MIKAILWDVDGTLLNFKASESASMKATYKYFDLGECSDETVARYSKINQGYWERLERGEVTKEQVLRCRFEDFLSQEGITSPSATEFCQYYEQGLADTIVYIDNSLELMKSLKGRVLQYAVTNGAKNVQHQKLANAKMDVLFDGVFISDEVGYEKPNKLFFDFVSKSIPKLEKSEIIIVGDSLTSDIKGGNNMDVLTCWYNPNGQAAGEQYHIDYEINNLNEIKQIINT